MTWCLFWGLPLSNPESHKSYRPLTILSFRLNRILHEMWPPGFHIVNVAAHTLVSVLFMQFCLKLGTTVFTSLVASLFFVSHPIHTEAVSAFVQIVISLILMGERSKSIPHLECIPSEKVKIYPTWEISCCQVVAKLYKLYYKCRTAPARKTVFYTALGTCKHMEVVVMNELEVLGGRLMFGFVLDQEPGLSPKRAGSPKRDFC